jgi:hypothetical protein
MQSKEIGLSILLDSKSPGEFFKITSRVPGPRHG